uniref:Uncharacterized protein n=1 Tax=Arundo donax TaxID=35708 RepID=A0A0A9F6T2_ARUDO
MVDLPGMKPN